MQVAELPDIKRKKQPDKVDENSSQGSSQARTEWSPLTFIHDLHQWLRMPYTDSKGMTVIF